MDELPPLETQTFTLATRDGLELFARRWPAVSNRQGVVVLVHGLGEHAGRYDQFATRMAGAGFDVVAHDQRGYGRSPRTHWPTYDQLLDDLGALLAWVDEADAGGPRFLLGQSFGGNLVLNLALRRSPDVTGLIAASPMLRLAQPLARWKEVGLRGLARVWPSFTIATGVRAEQLTADVNMQTRYREDSLIRRRVALQLARAMLDSGRWASERARQLALPALLLHGEHDEITCSAASRAFADDSDSCDFHAVQNGRHELLHSGGAEAVERIVAWMNRTSQEQSV